MTAARLPRDFLPSSRHRRAAGGRPQADAVPLTVTPSQVTAPVQLEALAVAVRGTDGQPVARLEVGSAGGAVPCQGLCLVHFLALPAALGRRGRTHVSRRGAGTGARERSSGAGQAGRGRAAGCRRGGDRPAEEPPREGAATGPGLPPPRALGPFSCALLLAPSSPLSPLHPPPCSHLPSLSLSSSLLLSPLCSPTPSGRHACTRTRTLRLPRPFASLAPASGSHTSLEAEGGPRGRSAGCLHTRPARVHPLVGGGGGALATAAFSRSLSAHSPA